MKAKSLLFRFTFAALATLPIAGIAQSTAQEYAVSFDGFIDYVAPDNPLRVSVQEKVNGQATFVLPAGEHFDGQTAIGTAEFSLTIGSAVYAPYSTQPDDIAYLTFDPNHRLKGIYGPNPEGIAGFPELYLDNTDFFTVGAAGTRSCAVDSTCGAFDFGNAIAVAVPEPSTFFLLGGGLALLGLRKRAFGVSQ